jgi:hypothetical protein
MRIFNIASTGDFKKTERFLKYLESGDMYNDLDHYGRMGVDALSRATPIDTGETAHDWGYQVEITKERASISWYNIHTNEGVNIAVIIQYGHGTGTGGYVAGRDYIIPAMQPLFDKIVEDVWRQVRNA